MPVDPDAWLAWRVEVAPDAPPELPEDSMKLQEDEDLAARLEVAFAPQVAEMALEVAYRKTLHGWWDAVVKRLLKVELDALDAILVLHSMVRMQCCNKQLLMKVVDSIECRYYSMQLGLGRHRAAEMFSHADSFQSLVDGLPVDHKIKIIIRDDVAREDGRLREKPPPPDPEPKKQWRTMDPVEMEEWEREQFEKGRLRVKRMRYVDAKVTRMRPGNKLGAAMALQLLQVLPAAAPRTLAEMAQICAFLPKVRPLRGDLLEDFQEALSRRVVALDTHQVRPHILAFASGMRSFPGPEACRAWRRKLVPAVLQFLSTTRSQLGLQVFDLQGCFHSHLRGVPHSMASEPSSPSGGDTEVLRQRTERAAELFLAVATASQVDLDTKLFDELVAPVKVALRRHLRASRDCDDDDALTTSASDSTSEGQLLPLETLADLVDACVSCGVDDLGAELPSLVLELFELQFGRDIREGRFSASKYSPADLAALAHGASILCTADHGVEETLSLLWTAMEPKLRSSQPHLVLMLLNALVRSGSEELLTSPSLAAAVDEHLVQRLDLDPSRLGRLGL